MWNYCPDCGAELVEDASFCQECGRELDEGKSVSTEKTTEEDSENSPTREDYRRILEEEMEKAKEEDEEEETRGAKEKLEQLLRENPEVYNDLGEFEQKVIDKLNLKFED